jgi:hypothetical protein
VQNGGATCQNNYSFYFDLPKKGALGEGQVTDDKFQNRY